MSKPIKFLSSTMITILKTPSAAITAGFFSWLTIEYVPSAMLFFYLLVAMLGDFVTGLLKSWKKGQHTSSEGLRRSVTKVLSYMGAILVIMVMVNVIGLVDEGNKYDLAMIINGLMGFIVFVELYSICENITEAYPESPLVKYFIIHIMTFLRGRFNSIKPKLEGITNDEPKVRNYGTDEMPTTTT